MTSRAYIQEEYFEWLYNMMCNMKGPYSNNYRKLLSYLHSVEFVFIIPRDVNRARDGIDLRRRFIEDADECLDGPCSILEMMIALALRCEETIMDDPRIGDRTAQWFWGMIVNLGINSMDDEHFDEKYVEQTIERFLSRNYEPDGTGGLFTVRNCDRDLRDVEIWYQLCWYLDNII